MDQAGTPLSGLPDSFAIFPLTGALLLPGGRLPLNIFEPRYRAMVEDSLGEGRMFGMIQPDPQRAAGPTGASVYNVGCLGRISSFSETDDGRYLITLSGVLRFTVLEELGMCRGYRRVRADLTRFAADLDPPVDMPGAPAGRAHLLEALRMYFAQRRIDANWEAIDQIAHDALVVTLAMVCPFQPAEKQALLEAPTQSARADALLALLRIDAHVSSDDEGAPRSMMS